MMYFRAFSVTIPDSLMGWTVSSHSTDNEMDSWRALPTNPELVTEARTRTLARLTPNLRLTTLAN